MPPAYRLELLSRTDVTEQKAIMEIVTSWTEQGIQQGIQQGEVALVMRQLARRFGQISPELEEQIHRLSTDQLEALGEALLDFSDVRDLQTWLENHY
jgi:predicted transposase YdaD